MLCDDQAYLLGKTKTKSILSKQEVHCCHISLAEINPYIVTVYSNTLITAVTKRSVKLQCVLYLGVIWSKSRKVSVQLLVL